MKNLYVSDLTEGMSLQQQTFAIYDYNRATDRNNNPYIDLTLSDKTGQVKAKVWQDKIPFVDSQALGRGRVVAVDAEVETYKSDLQLNIQNLSQVDETRVEDYIAASEYDPEKMFSKLQSHIDSIENEDLALLFDNIFADPEMKRKFKYWPAANSYHHEFRSGLLQHVLECLGMVTDEFLSFYPNINKDLVKAGLILHDIGKFEEIDADSMTSVYTTRGNVLGHLYLGVEILNRFYPESGDPKIKLHLQHIILSHHGDKASGSPVVPGTAEAMLVAHLDLTSAQVRMADRGVKDKSNEYGITQYNRWLDRWMWAENKPDQMLPGSNSDVDEEIVYTAE